MSYVPSLDFENYAHLYWTENRSQLSEDEGGGLVFIVRRIIHDGSEGVLRELSMLTLEFKMEG